MGEIMDEKRLQRQTAKKIPIQVLLQGQYITTEGLEPNHIFSSGQRIARANFMGVIIGKSNSEMMTYEYLILDDGSGRITVRSFDESNPQIQAVNIGEVVNVIGRPREYGGEIFLVPEVVKKIDSKWVEYRKIEMKKLPQEQLIETPVQQAPETSEVQEETVISPEIKLLNTIRSKDQGDGVLVQELVQEQGETDASSLIKKLMEQGDIFETRPGKVKVLE
jgi:RPA family protein